MMSISLTNNRWIQALILVISLLGGALAWYATANGPWGYTDPVGYLATARSLAQGRGIGYYEADTHFNWLTNLAPFYAIALSLPVRLGMEPVVAARGLNVLAFVLVIFLGGWAFVRFSPAPSLGIAVSLLLAIFPWMVVMFSSAYSEPLFLLLFLVANLTLLAALQDVRWTRLVGSAILFGTLPITRYAGLPLIFAAAIFLFVYAPGRLIERVRIALSFALLASLPIATWLVVVYFYEGYGIGTRILALDVEALARQFKEFRAIFLDTVWKWLPFQSAENLLRYRIRWILTTLAVLLVTSLSFLAHRNIRQRHKKVELGWHLFVLFGLMALTYLAFVLVTFLFVRPTIDLNERILLPFYVSGLISLFAAFSLWQRAWFQERLAVLQAITWLLTFVTALWYVPQTLEKAQFFHQGQGWTAFRWQRSALVQAVKALPEAQPVIANDWEMLTLWTGRPIYSFWLTFPAASQRGPYGSNPNDPWQRLFCQQNAALVILNDFPAQVRQRLGEEALTKMPTWFKGLVIYGEYSDGTIYQCRLE